MLNFGTLIANAKLNFGDSGGQRLVFIDIDSKLSHLDSIFIKRIAKIEADSKLSHDDLVSIIRLYRSRLERSSYRIATTQRLLCHQSTEVVNAQLSITTTVISDNTVNINWLARFTATTASSLTGYTVTGTTVNSASSHSVALTTESNISGVNIYNNYANSAFGLTIALSTVGALSWYSYTPKSLTSLSRAKITSNIGGLYVKHSTNIRNINNMWDGWQYVPPVVYVDPRRYCGLNFCFSLPASRLNFTDSCCGDIIPPDGNTTIIPTKEVYMLYPTSYFKDDGGTSLNCTAMTIRSSTDSFCYSVTGSFPLSSLSVLLNAAHFIADDCGTTYKLYLIGYSVSRSFNAGEIQAEFSTMPRALTEVVTTYPDNGQTNIAGIAQLMMSGLTIDMVQPDFFVDHINLSGVDTAARLMAKMLDDCGLRMITGRSDGVLYIKRYYPAKGWEAMSATIAIPTAFSVTDSDKTELRPTYNSVTINGTGTVPITALVVASGINTIAEKSSFGSNILQHNYPIAAIGEKLLTNNGSRRVVGVSVDTDSTIPVFTVGDIIDYNGENFFLTGVTKSVSFGSSQADLTLERFIYD